MTTTYVYLILDRNEETLECWGSKKRAVERCYQLAKREFDQDFQPMDGDRGSVARVGDAYRFWVWQKMTVKR